MSAKGGARHDPVRERLRAGIREDPVRRASD